MNKEQQIEEFQNDITDNLFGGGTYTLAEALYNAGYRKVPDGAVDEITRLNNIEAELQELNIKYYNEAKDLRRELTEVKAENEKRLKASEDFATKHCRMKCEIAKMRVKEFAEKLKAKADTIENPIIQFLPKDNKLAEHLKYVKVVNICEIDELLKEYEK